MKCRVRLLLPLLTLAAQWLWAPLLCAEDYFLTIGGGYGPTSNQLSIERNVIFQQATLASRRADQPRHDVYFSDGDDESRDVQFRDSQFEKTCPPARRLLAEILGDADSMDLAYRNNEIGNLTGPAELALVKRRFRELSRELASGDRLIVYVTGHGGEAEEASDDDYDYQYDEETQSWKATARTAKSDQEINKHDTSFYLWDADSVSASEFTTWLDRLPMDVEVVLVMVQCFAGGFAHTIFHEADANLGVSPHARCGFFAQVHDRGAAGCTPDANEADYEEYSSYFWGALGGKSRTGRTIENADYNGDGRVSFAEAHAYAVIESDTIDIPVRTTSAFARRYSHLGKKRKESESGEGEKPFGRFLGLLGETPSSDGPKFAEMKGPLAALAALARPEQRAIIEQLPLKVGLGDRATVEDVRRKLRQIDTEGKAATAKHAAATKARDRALERLQDEVRQIWPELNADYAPLAMALANERAQEFVERVEALPAYKSFRAASERVEQLQEEPLRLARQEARLQRLLRTCEDVVMVANLPRVAPAEIVQRHAQLLAMEEGTL